MNGYKNKSHKLLGPEIYPVKPPQCQFTMNATLNILWPVKSPTRGLLFYVSQLGGEFFPNFLEG